MGVWAEVAHTACLHSQANARAGGGCGAGDGEALEILDSPQSDHCQPSNSAETTQRASVSWPPPGPIPGQGARTGWHRASGEGKMSFHSRSAADPAKVLVPPMYGEREKGANLSPQEPSHKWFLQNLTHRCCLESDAMPSAA